MRQDLDRERREEKRVCGVSECNRGRIKRALFSVGQFGSDLAAFATTSLAACGLAGPFESVAIIQLVLVLSFLVLSVGNDHLDASTTKNIAFGAL